MSILILGSLFSSGYTFYSDNDEKKVCLKPYTYKKNNCILFHTVPELSEFKPMVKHFGKILHRKWLIESIIWTQSTWSKGYPFRKSSLLNVSWNNTPEQNYCDSKYHQVNCTWNGNLKCCQRLQSTCGQCDYLAVPVYSPWCRNTTVLQN